MKKLITSLLSIAALVAVVSSCTKPDGEAALKSISLPSGLNSSLSSTISGTIDETTKTVTFVIPTAVETSSFIPEFTLTRDDILSVNGNEVVSGSTSISITESTKLIVDDAASGLSISYSVVVIPNDLLAALTSLVIAASDNPQFLSEDVNVEIASEMIPRVPKEAFRQELTISLEATTGDIIKVNNNVIEGGKAKNVDTSFPVDIEVIDEVAGQSAKYILKVGKILESKVDLIATYSSDDLIDYVALAVDQVADVPYLVVNENNTVNDVTTKELITVLKYDGTTSLSVVGNRKFSGGRTYYAMIDVLDGKPYVVFADNTATTKKNRLTCMSFDGTWNLVGNQGFGATLTGLSYYRQSLIIDPISKNPIVAYTSNEVLGSVAKRDLAIAMYNGSEWLDNQAVNGRTQDYCYNEKLARDSEKVVLLAANQNEKTFSLYQYKDNSWSVLQNALAIAGTSDICTYFMDAEIAPDGTIYGAVGDNSSGSYLCQLYKYNGTELVVAANPLPGVSFDDKEGQWDLTFDSLGNPVVAVIAPIKEEDGSLSLSTKLFSIDPETKDWAEPINIPEIPSGMYLAAGRADNGNVYFAFSSEDTNGKFTINLYKYSVEADVLPE